MKVIHNKQQQQDIPYSSQISRSTNPAHNFIISILRRLEFLGLYSILKVLPSLGRRSSTSNYIKNNKTMRTYSIVSMCLFFVLILLILFPINIKFNKAEAAPNVPSTRDQYLNVTATTYDSVTGKLTVTKDSIPALTDQRDNKVYTIAKLADGKCWMTENLRLDNSANITVSNTQSYNNSFGEVFIGLPESSNTGWSTNVSNNLYPESLKLNTFTLPQLNTNNTNNNLPSSHNNNTLFSRWSSYGNYYSWAAAVADTAPAEF